MTRIGRPRRFDPWVGLVPVVALAAGLLFATSSTTAQGTDLRGGEVTELSALIEERDSTVAGQQAELAALQEQVQALTDLAASRNGEVAAVQQGAAPGVSSAGLAEITGPGLAIELDDAPRPSAGTTPTEGNPDNLVIHQSDVQGVVNALWAAGADGVAIMGQRLISTSAVICVGPTLLLHGRTYSPPYVITAVGDADEMRDELAASPGVQVFQEAADDYGLTFDVEEQDHLTLSAYDGALDMQYARVG
ncbi:DUF881 domain-containing protein [Modestobacter sp. VKM Ac-2979]|uniref:DUF881 domain-containing protein n=1 Tax=unclassified Modestobacter TaxID=2643866 RepID=UPI0022AB9736|nr:MULTISPECIES: DUF881 domain-containing protein [unclassified Modestobacter]MCZ2810887.1 DUF881 domain-containing protein [Modestobacter sp. VKM Ac-2979]MCZ2840400.1 DUF881 domain-containing protein [Modestobacter sp. VKM Ac-2980]